MKTLKFGGSSLATTEAWKQALNLIRSLEDVHSVVVSAIGKSGEGDEKVTTILKRICAKRGEKKNWRYDWSVIVAKFTAIAKELQIKTGELHEDLRLARKRIEQGCSRDEVLSRGEYITARLFARYIGFSFLDPYHFIEVEDGKPKITPSTLEIKWPSVIAGFYGQGPEGEIAIFADGGGDISAAWVAVMCNTDLYRCSDTPIRSADPRIAKNTFVVEALTYVELAEIASVAPNVLHPDAIHLCQRYKVPVYIKETANAGGVVTKVVEKRNTDQTPVVGVNMQEGYYRFALKQPGLHTKPGVIEAMASVLTDFGVSIRTSSGGGNSNVFFVHENYLAKTGAQKIADAIRKHHLLENATVEVDDGYSLLSVVGEGMIGRFGYLETVAGAVAKAEISMQSIDSPPTEGVIEFYVAAKQGEQAVEAVHDELYC